MKDRILKLMETQHMNQQTFSQLTGINPATLSNILKDKTSPTLNQVTAIRRKFPSINLDWLLYGEGGMFLPAQSQDPQEAMLQEPSFDDPSLPFSGQSAKTANLAEGVLDFVDAPEVQTPVNTATVNRSQQRSATMQQQVRMPQNIGVMQNVSRKITEIRVFYDDQTWESFVPKK